MDDVQNLSMQLQCHLAHPIPDVLVIIWIGKPHASILGDYSLFLILNRRALNLCYILRCIDLGGGLSIVSNLQDQTHFLKGHLPWAMQRGRMNQMESCRVSAAELISAEIIL